MKKFCLLFLTFFLLLNSPLLAKEPFVFSSVRALGMGGVGVAIPDLESVLYANPAALAFVENNYWNIFSGAALLDSKTLDTGRYIRGHLNNYQNVFEKMIAIAALAENNHGSVSLGTSLATLPVPFLNYVSRNYGYGGFAQGYSEVKITNNPGPQITVEGSYEAAAILGYGVAVTKEFGVGLNLKYLGRLGTYDTHTQSRTYQLSNENIYKGNYNINGLLGFGPAIDIAGLAVLDTDWGKNYLGLTAYNVYGKIIGSTTSASQFIDYFFDIGNYTPELSQSYSEKVPTTVIFGATSIFKNEPLKDWLVSFEYPITPRKQGFNNIKLGLEKAIREGSVLLRCGFNQGTYCLGTSIYFGKDIRLDYAYNIDYEKKYFWHAFEIKIISKEYPLGIEEPTGTIRYF
jgi:hypothetical protein